MSFVRTLWALLVVYGLSSTAAIAQTPTISSLNPSSAAIGQSVTIAGSDFGASQGTSTVSFNGAPASVTSWGDISITVTVPVSGATGPVIVTTSGGVSNGLTFVVPAPVSYTYDAAGRLIGVVDGTWA